MRLTHTSLNMKLRTLLAATLMAATAPALLATPSGLNNIPTADTTGQGTVVVQAYSDFGIQHDTDFAIGFKSGLDFGNFGKAEFGADSALVPGQGGPVVLQFKYAHDVWDGGTLALGIANLTLDAHDRDRAGDPFTYPILSQKVGNDWFRFHVGYGFQTDGNSVLLGLDKTVKFWEREVTFRTDFIQIQDQRQWEGSFGVLFPVCKYIVLESWMSQPLSNGSPIFTAKLNFVFTF